MAETYNATAENTNFQPSGPGNGDGRPLQKDFSRGESGRVIYGFANGADHDHLHDDMDADTALKRIRTTGSLSISPELFEKIYLSPQNRVSGDLRKTFGNPTPIALCGFLLSLTPLSCDLMGWRGAGGNGAASTAVFFFFGGVLMLFGSFGEWIIGNTFPCVVFGSFGAFWLSFGGTLQPFYNAWGAYTTSGTANGGLADGLSQPKFDASFAFFLVWMGVLCFVYMICALRTNLVFFGIFLFLIPSFGCLAGAFWHLAQGNIDTANNLVIAGGACTFVVDMLGWWIFVAIMLASLDFPFSLPVGDLSRYVKGASDRAKAKEYDA